MPFRPLSCVFGSFFIPQYVIIPIMLHLALWHAYHFRVVLTIAMAEMKAPVNNTMIVDACPGYKREKLRDIIGGRYEWSNNQETLILGGFYIGYVISHIPGGWLADRFGARHVMGFSILISSIITLLYPVAVETNSFAVAFLMRVILGFVEGPLFPCIAAFIQCWVPHQHRSLLGTIAYTGSNPGSITGNIFTGIMIRVAGSWELPFYVWPLPAIVWYIFYLFMVFSNPQTHPFITKKELEYLETELPKKTKFKPAWPKILRSASTYALICGQLGHDYIYFTISTVLPKYMTDILKVNIQNNAIYNSIPFVCIWISSILASFAADYVINRKIMSVLSVRRSWTLIGNVIPGIILVIVTYVGCDRVAAIILYSLSMFIKGFFFSGMKVNVNDITLHHAGVIMALANGIGASTGLVSPVIVGLLTKRHSLEEWRTFMWIVLVVECVTTVIYWVFTKAEREPWDYTEEELNEMNSDFL